MHSLAALCLASALVVGGQEGAKPKYGSGREAQPAHASSKKKVSATEIATQIDERLTAMSDVHRMLLDDPCMRIGKCYLGEARRAADRLLHDDNRSLVQANLLHINLDELLRALDQIDVGTCIHRESKSPQPWKKVSQDTRKEIIAIKKLANESKSLTENAFVQLDESTPASYAVEYAHCILDEINVLLYCRGVNEIWPAGRRNTDRDMGGHLDKLRAAIGSLVDSSGKRVQQMDEGGKQPLADQLSVVKACFKEAKKQASMFKDSFMSSDVSVPKRIERVEGKLKVLEENILRPKSLREVVLPE